MLMTDPWDEARLRLQRKEALKKSQKDAERRRRERYDAMGPAELARDLRERCNIEGLNSLEDLEERLLKQALTLDASFFISMHEAGLGYKTDLHLDSLKTAMHAQKLCRQTYDTLKSDTLRDNIGKQIQGSAKNET